MRHRFNEGGYVARLAAGELIAEITLIGPAPARFPKGFQSQILTYQDARSQTVAIVHQYGRPDGTPAKGTRPDPKFLFEDGVRFKLQRL